MSEAPIGLCILLSVIGAPLTCIFEALIGSVQVRNLDWPLLMLPHKQAYQRPQRASNSRIDRGDPSPERSFPNASDSTFNFRQPLRELGFNAGGME